MKKISFVLLLTVFISISAKAQTASGNMMIGGGISFSSQSYQSNSDVGNSSFNFSPDFGYFVADNFAVGAAFRLGTSTNDNAISKTQTTTVGFGPYARYYKFTSNENFAFFGQAQFLLSSSTEDDTPGDETKSSFVEFSISPGFSYFLTKHWALDLRFQGLVITSTDPNKDNDDDKSTVITFGINSFSPTFGVRYHFGM